MTERHIVPATPQDADAIAMIHRLSHTVSYMTFLEEGRIQWPTLAEYRANWQKRLANQQPLDATYIASLDAQTAGFLHIEPLSQRYSLYDHIIAAGIEPVQTGLVSNIHIHPDHLGHGIGQALMVTGKAYMRQQGWTQAVLDTQVPNTRARRFYETNGWTAFGTVQHPGAPFETVFYRCDL